MTDRKWEVTEPGVIEMRDTPHKFKIVHDAAKAEPYCLTDYRGEKIISHTLGYLKMRADQILTDLEAVGKP